MTRSEAIFSRSAGFVGAIRRDYEYPSLKQMDHGYCHAHYASALSEFGRPRLLPESGGWILEREIPGADSRDAMGCYPIFCCRDWRKLSDDLERIGDELVSLVIVTDPFGGYNEQILQGAFRDLAKPFKQHLIIDLNRQLESFVHPHHQRNTRKAQGEVEIEHALHPERWSEDWNNLYGELVRRHSITGIGAFSQESFEKQFRVPGLSLFRATRDGETVGITLWFISGDQGYYHLGAYSELGYRTFASFALFWHALEYFQQQGVRRISLGAAAGISNKGRDGLTRFKQGWASCTRTAYLCGRIFRPDQYRRLELEQGMDTTYFPAYRHGEFR